jgi:hypothetical protein
MSRTVVVALAALLAQFAAARPAFAGSETALSNYERLTAVTPHCVSPSTESEILVCGRRAADRWRVPYIGYEAGDPRGETVMQERERLAADHPLPCGVDNVLANCGMVGVSVGTRFGVGGTELKLRPLAP